MDTWVISDEAYFGPFTSWQQLSLNHILNGAYTDMQITCIDCWLWYVQDKQICWWHWWSVHIFIWRYEIYRSLLKFSPVLEVLPYSSSSKRRVVIVLCRIEVSTEIADPFHAVINESYKWIDVRSTVLASNDWLLSICDWIYSFALS